MTMNESGKFVWVVAEERIPYSVIEGKLSTSLSFE